MKKAEIFGYFVDTCLAWLMLLAIVIFTKLAFDFLSAPNVFITAKEEVMSQKQTDEMCVKWWFDSDLTAAKKRVCGK
jgi:ABC-type uncharacterized transport system substrate-binding protein